MSTQITTRLPDEDVAFLDQIISDGVVKDRTDGVHRAVELLRRYVRAQREIAIVKAVNASGEALYPDLEGLSEWASRRPMDID